MKDITRESFSSSTVLSSHLIASILFFRIIAKGAGGGLGSGGVSSSRGSILSSVIELHKDEEIYILVGQNGEHACIKSMGIQDESCSTEAIKHSDLPKTHLVKDVHNYSKRSILNRIYELLIFSLEQQCGIISEPAEEEVVHMFFW